jgi:hypothetical protein
MSGSSIKNFPSLSLPHFLSQLIKVELIDILVFLPIVDFILDHTFIYLFFVSLLILGSLLPIFGLMLDAQVTTGGGSLLLLLICDGTKATLVLFYLFPSIKNIAMAVKGVFEVLFF